MQKWIDERKKLKHLSWHENLILDILRLIDKYKIYIAVFFIGLTFGLLIMK